MVTLLVSVRTSPNIARINEPTALKNKKEFPMLLDKNEHGDFCLNYIKELIHQKSQLGTSRFECFSVFWQRIEFYFGVLSKGQYIKNIITAISGLFYGIRCFLGFICLSFL